MSGVVSGEEYRGIIPSVQDGGVYAAELELPLGGNPWLNDEALVGFRKI